MAYKPIRMDIIGKIIQYHKEGKPKKQIARLLGISKNTVKSYINRYSILDDSDDVQGQLLQSEAQLQEEQRSSDLENRFSDLVSELGRTGVTRFLLWEEYKKEVSDGYSYSRFCQRMRDYRSRTNTTMRIEHKAAYRLTVDYAGKKMRWVDKASGEVHVCEVLICTLPYSGYTYACAVPSQRQEDFIQAINNCLLYQGGCPKVLLSVILPQKIRQ